MTVVHLNGFKRPWRSASFERGDGLGRGGVQPRLNGGTFLVSETPRATKSRKSAHQADLGLLVLLHPLVAVAQHSNGQTHQQEDVPRSCQQTSLCIGQEQLLSLPSD